MAFIKEYLKNIDRINNGEAITEVNDLEDDQIVPLENEGPQLNQQNIYEGIDFIPSKVLFISDDKNNFDDIVIEKKKAIKRKVK